MTTPKAWMEYAARALDREQRKSRDWIWSADRDATPDQVQRAKRTLAQSMEKRVEIEGVIWTRVDLR